MRRVKKKVQSDELISFLVSKVQIQPPTPSVGRSLKSSYAFVAPEISSVTDIQDFSGFKNKPSWDVAVRYQDLKRFGHIPEKEKKLLQKRAIEGILERAHQILGPALRAEKNVTVGIEEFNELGGRGDLDVLSTVEEMLVSIDPLSAKTLRFDAKKDKEVDIALLMDASLSMTGEKIALLAVAAAVVAICIPSQKLALVGFDSKVRFLKNFGEDMPLVKIIEKVLELPAGGFTNLEYALQEILKNLRRKGRKQANVILITDGKYTEGLDPLYLAKEFRKLNALKIGRDHAGRNLLIDLTSQGGGRFFEARRLSDLPKVMYGALKELMR